MSKRPQPQLAIIGLDGGTFDLIDPWVEQGLLPNLAGLISRGCRARLLSTQPPISPAAWSAFMTGQNPGKTGICGFTALKPNTYEIRFANGGLIAADTIWPLLNTASYTVGLLNIPMTYPPEPLDGYVVAGLDAPDAGLPYTHPPQVRHELAALPEGYTIDVRHDDLATSAEGYEGTIQGMLRLVESRAAALQHLMANRATDVLVAVFTATDRAGHLLWHLTDSTHPKHSPELLRRHGDALLRIHQHIDEKLGEVLTQLPESATVVVMSDHGMGPLHHTLDLNAWLEAEGYLVRGSATGSALSRAANALMVRLWSALPRRTRRALRLRFPGARERTVSRLGFPGVDWPRTRAFAVAEQVYINARGSHPQGCVEPGAQYEALRSELRRRLTQITAPDGSPMVPAVHAREQLYQGPELQRFGDLIVDLGDGPFDAIFDSSGRSGASVSDPSPVEGTTIARSGAHRSRGIFCVSGPNIREAEDVGEVSILDIAPTMLFALGLVAPGHIDGRCLTEIFTPQFVGAQQLRQVNGSGGPRSEADGIYSDEEEQAVARRLQDLGYL